MLSASVAIVPMAQETQAERLTSMPRFSNHSSCGRHKAD